MEDEFDFKTGQSVRERGLKGGGSFNLPDDEVYIHSNYVLVSRPGELKRIPKSVEEESLTHVVSELQSNIDKLQNKLNYLYAIVFIHALIIVTLAYSLAR